MVEDKKAIEMKVRFVIYILILCTVFTHEIVLADVQKLDLPLEVFQALREGVKGVNFENEYVRIGLPFPRGMVKDLQGRAALSVEDREFQSRVLKRWPDGSIKWALIEFLDSVSTGGMERAHLKEGTGVSNGKFLAEDRGGLILIDTGPMHMEIRKEGFNMFNRVIVDGQEIVKDNSSRGILIIEGEGKEFLASQDRKTKVIIEENGPVSAVVRVDGGHYHESGKLLDYTMRLFFYKGKSRVKVQYTLRNAGKDSVKHAFLRSLNLEIGLNVSENKKVIISTHKGPKELDLQKGDVNYYQAVSDFPWMSDGGSFYYKGPISPDTKRKGKRGYRQEGYWVRQDGSPLFEGGRKEFPDMGYMDISDSNGKGVTAGIRYMAGQWPKGLKTDASGKMVVSLWPEENETGYWIRYGSHNTFEIIYNFHSNLSHKPEEEMKRFQYPLVARAPVEWYNRNVEGIYPLYHFISFSGEKKLAEKLGIKYRVGWRKPPFKVWRYHYWGTGGYLNQHDFSRIALMNFLRDDRDILKAGESYLLAESMVNYYADWSVYHSDDYDYSKMQLYPRENHKEAELAKVVFEWEHQHWYGMPLYYYMTGDERIKDAVTDWGDYLKTMTSPINLTHMRVFGTGMFSLAAMYEFTGDEQYLRLSDMNFQNLLNSRYNPKKPYANIFIDWERGIVTGGSGSGWNPENLQKSGIKADLMLGSLLYDGLLNYYFMMKKDNASRDKAYELLMKISEFMYKEPYFEGTKRGEWAFWIPYVYNLSDREKSNHSYKLVGQASFWTVFPYSLTGEKRWTERMEKMVKMAMFDEDGVWGSFGYMDHPGFQTMAYHLEKYH